jgi:hypothetical protein
MSDGIDNRQFQRRPLNERVFAYIDGQRVDVQSANVSFGGLFVKTRRAEKIPLGARLALVFHTPDAVRNKIYLVAKVRRHQSEPVAGVGLSWEKATTVGSAQALARFLNKILRIRAEVIETKIVPEDGSNRNVYYFSQNVREAAEGETPPVQVVEGKKTAPAPTTAMPAWTPPPPPDDATDGAEDTSEDESITGPLTEQIQVDRLLAPARFDATLLVAGHLLRGTVTSIGVFSFVFDTSMTMAGPFDDVTILLALPVEGVSHEIQCRCRMTAIVPSSVPGRIGLEFDFNHVDEGATVGVLQAYVRWLHTTSVANS